MRRETRWMQLHLRRRGRSRSGAGNRCLDGESDGWGFRERGRSSFVLGAISGPVPSCQRAEAAKGTDAPTATRQHSSARDPQPPTLTQRFVPSDRLS